MEARGVEVQSWRTIYYRSVALTKGWSRAAGARRQRYYPIQDIIDVVIGAVGSYGVGSDQGGVYQSGHASFVHRIAGEIVGIATRALSEVQC